MKEEEEVVGGLCAHGDYPELCAACAAEWREERLKKRIERLEKSIAKEIARAILTEREACAALCDAMQESPDGSSEGYEGECALRIRERGQAKG